MRRQALVLIFLATMIGCDSPTSPDSAKATRITLSGDDRFTEINQVHFFLLRAEFEGQPLRDVTTEAVWESSDTSVVTVSGGVVIAVAVGSATITASYQSYHASLDVRVVVADAAARLSGNYRFTFTAASACGSMPAWAKHREYDATIDRASDGSVVLNVTLTTGKTVQFEVKVRDTDLEIEFPFHLSYGYYGQEVPTFADQIDAQRFFTLQGTATAGLHSSKMTGTLHGRIRANNLSCGVQDHQFTLERR